MAGSRAQLLYKLKQHAPALSAGGPTMLIDFFYTLRAAKLPVSVKEFLTCWKRCRRGRPPERRWSLDDFYYLARTTLVKDEKHYDKFDRAFAAYFKGVEMLADFTKEIPPTGCARCWSAS
jgi:uncharacterized protein with von Willebrand factor type A (vWA) domain